MDDFQKKTDEVSGQRPETSPIQSDPDGAVGGRSKSFFHRAGDREVNTASVQANPKWGKAGKRPAKPIINPFQGRIPAPWSGSDPLVEQAESDWRFLSDWDNLNALARIDRRIAREELIREWDRDVRHALRRDRGILDMGARFLNFMENEAPQAATAEELIQGADATLGYMVHDVGRLAEKRERLMRQLDRLHRDPSTPDAQALLRRLGAADPAQWIRKYKAAGMTRSAEKRQAAQSALSAIVRVNANAAEHVKNTLEREKSRKPLVLEDTQAEQVFPALRALFDERRFAQLKSGGLSPEELRDSLSAWAGEIETTLIKADDHGEDREGKRDGC